MKDYKPVLDDLREQGEFNSTSRLLVWATAFFFFLSFVVYVLSNS